MMGVARTWWVRSRGMRVMRPEREWLEKMELEDSGSAYRGGCGLALVLGRVGEG